MDRPRSSSLDSGAKPTSRRRTDSTDGDGNDSLPSGWVQKFDSKKQKYYYMNSSTKVTQWEHPGPGPGAGAGAGAEGGEGDWEEGYSEKHQRRYWKNLTTGEKVWKDPRKKKSTEPSSSSSSSSSPSGGEGDWEEGYSEKHQRRYWKNVVTGEKVWKNPLKGTGVGAGAGADPPESTERSPTRRLERSKTAPPSAHFSPRHDNDDDDDGDDGDGDGGGDGEWEEKFNAKHQRKFWRNRVTGETTWKDPTKKSREGAKAQRTSSSDADANAEAYSTPSSPSASSSSSSFSAPTSSAPSSAAAPQSPKAPPSPGPAPGAGGMGTPPRPPLAFLSSIKKAGGDGDAPLSPAALAKQKNEAHFQKLKEVCDVSPSPSPPTLPLRPSLRPPSPASTNLQLLGSFALYSFFSSILFLVQSAMMNLLQSSFRRAGCPRVPSNDEILALSRMPLYHNFCCSAQHTLLFITYHTSHIAHRTPLNKYHTFLTHANSHTPHSLSFSHSLVPPVAPPRSTPLGRRRREAARG